MLDLKIVGGVVVDGTGAEPRRADVGIANGRIVLLGDVDTAARETIAADGCIVTPGFVDLHCHFDGQATWDETLAPSVNHGVTTAVMGNCGVGFAPVRRGDEARLIDLMEGVEDIPGSALSLGLRWNWSDFPSYLDALDAIPHSLDLCAQVPHDALRVYVMGERGLMGAPATAEDIAAMQAELSRALVAGAVGFSTGRSDVHRSRSGHATPAAEANAAELVALAQTVAAAPHGVLQAVSDFDLEQSEDRFDPEFDLLEAMACTRMSLSLSQRDLAPTQWRRILARVADANARGLPMRVQVAPRGIGVFLGLTCTFHPFMGFPSYKAVAHLPLPERVARMRAPGFKERILGEQMERLSGDGTPIPPLADKLLAMLDRIVFRMYQLAEVPDYEPPVAASLGARAMALRRPPLDVLFDALLDDDGRALIYFPIYNYLEGNLDAVREMLGSPHALPGLSDGGAHVGTVCDASFPTWMLSHWARDRKTAPLPLARVVQMMTADTADHLGLNDRGRIQVGLRADLNVIDHARVHAERPRMVTDLPGGAQRLVQGAVGYRATLVRGRVTVRDDQLTDARPGRVVRRFAR